MGHNIEYFAAVPEPVVRRWLDRSDGSYFPSIDGGPSGWEGRLESGGDTFWAYMRPAACNFALSMKYSGLYHEFPAAVDFARRFEAEFWGQFGPVPLVRVDEYLVGEWYRAVGRRDWWEFERPVDELMAWLPSQESHWHRLDPNGQPAAPDPGG